MFTLNFTGDSETIVKYIGLTTGRNDEEVIADALMMYKRLVELAVQNGGKMKLIGKKQDAQIVIPIKKL